MVVVKEGTSDILILRYNGSTFTLNQTIPIGIGTSVLKNCHISPN
jgi:hypothetical protein